MDGPGKDKRYIKKKERERIRDEKKFKKVSKRLCKGKGCDKPGTKSKTVRGKAPKPEDQSGLVSKTDRERRIRVTDKVERTPDKIVTDTPHETQYRITTVDKTGQDTKDIYKGKTTDITSEKIKEGKEKSGYKDPEFKPRLKSKEVTYETPSGKVELKTGDKKIGSPMSRENIKDRVTVGEKESHSKTDTYGSKGKAKVTSTDVYKVDKDNNETLKTSTLKDKQGSATYDAKKDRVTVNKKKKSKYVSLKKAKRKVKRR